MYQCKRCYEYKSENKHDVLRHLNKNKKCVRNILSYQYDEDEIEKHSVIKMIDEKEKTEFLCNICQKYFSRKDSLKRHLSKHDEQLNEDNKNKDINEYKNIIPLNKKWNLDHIDKLYILDILLKYDLKNILILEEILKNDENLNIISDIETNTSVVYINENEFIIMNNKELEKIVINKICKIFYEIINIEKTKKYSELYENYLDNLYNHIEQSIFKINENEKSIINIYYKEKERSIKNIRLTQNFRNILS